MTFERVLAGDGDRAGSGSELVFHTVRPGTGCRADVRTVGMALRPIVWRAGLGRAGADRPIDHRAGRDRPRRAAARLASDEIEYGGIERVSVSRALQPSDPDGNRIVVTGQ